MKKTTAYHLHFILGVITGTSAVVLLAAIFFYLNKII